MATKPKNKRLLNEAQFNQLDAEKKKRAVRLNGGYYIVYPLELAEERFKLKQSLKTANTSNQETERDNASRKLGEDLTLNDFKVKNQELSKFMLNASSVLDKDWRLFFHASPEMDWVKKSLNALNSVLDEGMQQYVNEQGIFDSAKYQERVNKAFSEFITAAQNYCDVKDPSSPPGKRRKKQVAALLKRAKQMQLDTKTISDAAKDGAIDFSAEKLETMNSYNFVNELKSKVADPLTVEWQNEGNSTDVYKMKLLGSDGRTYYLKENLPFLNENIGAFLNRRYKQLDASQKFVKSEKKEERELAEERLAKIDDDDYKFAKNFLKNLSDDLKSVGDDKYSAAEERISKYFAHNFDDVFRRLTINNLIAEFANGAGGDSIDDKIEEARMNGDEYRVAALRFAKSVMEKEAGENEAGALKDRYKKMTAAEWLAKEFGLTEENDKAFLKSLKGMSDKQIETMFRVTMGKEVELFGQMSAQQIQRGTDKAAVNNTAVSRIAEHLGFDDVVTKSETALVKFTRRDKTEVNQLCTLCEEARGRELVDLMKEAEKTGKKLVYSSEAIRNLIRLQAFDTLTFQKDRHGRNFKCLTEKDTATGNIIIKSVKAYDNDMSLDPLSLEEAFKNKTADPLKKVQFLPNMTMKVEKGSALYKNILGSYFGVDVVTPQKEVKTPDIKIGGYDYKVKGDALGYGAFYMWRSKDAPRKAEDLSADWSSNWRGRNTVKLKKELSKDEAAQIEKEMQEFGIKYDPGDTQDIENAYRKYAFEKLVSLSNDIRKIWDNPECKVTGWMYYFSGKKHGPSGFRKDLSLEERVELSKKMAELEKLGEQFDFSQFRKNDVPVVDAFIKSLAFVHGITYGDTMDMRIYNSVNNYEDFKLLLDKKGNLEIPSLLHFDEEAHEALKTRAKDYADKNSAAYQKLKELGLSDDKIKAIADRDNEYLKNLETARLKAEAFYRLAGWTEKPQNTFFLKKEDYKELKGLSELSVNPGNTYLAVDNENYLVGQTFKMRVKDHYENVPYKNLMNENEIKEAEDYNTYIRNDDKRWKYKEGEAGFKKFDKANTADITANSTNAKDYIQCCMHDKIYELSHKPVQNKAELGAKIKDVIFLRGLANGLEKMENLDQPVKNSKAKEYMKDNSVFRQEFDKCLTRGAGAIYATALERGFDEVFTENRFKQLDDAYMEKFNEICLDGMFGKIFEKLKAPGNQNAANNANEAKPADLNNTVVKKVIELAVDGGKIAVNTGVKAEDALNHYIAKHPNAVPENVVAAVKEGFKQIAIGPKAAVAGGPQMQAGVQQVQVGGQIQQGKPQAGLGGPGGMGIK